MLNFVAFQHKKTFYPQTENFPHREAKVSVFGINGFTVSFRRCGVCSAYYLLSLMSPLRNNLHTCSKLCLSPSFVQSDLAESQRRLHHCLDEFTQILLITLLLIVSKQRLVCMCGSAVCVGKQTRSLTKTVYFQIWPQRFP